MMNKFKLLEPSFYEINEDGSVTIVETNQTGEAELVVRSKNQAISFRIKEGNGFSYLKVKNTPDGIVFEKNATNHWILHVFECKKTVSEKSWTKAKKQFKGGILHAQMLRGLLDIPEFSMIKLYTVYRHDKLLTYTQDPGLLRQPVGVAVKKSPYQDWNEEELSMLWYDHLSHIPILLDEEGKGSMR